MKADALRLLFTYTIALVLIVGGLVFLYVVSADPSNNQVDVLIPLVAGFIGAAVQFVFGQEAGTRAARMTERALFTPAPGSNGGLPPNVGGST